uniref:Phytochromobilin:ferredoxin oxidoreductase, chloroplastic n=1 Tax=Nelumbo nucifera TaxID=4432 RepID=A0A822YDP2_NELNU|nr:TPA_asm: hypothetical protein HUJ06_031731 [Nelumbo nucifera]
MLAFQAPNIKLLRSHSIEESETMQILDLAVLPEPELDLPIFCANFFTTANMNIVVLDLNPTFDVMNHSDYKQKYYKNLMPLITSESLRFFSPIVIWTKFTSTSKEMDASQVICNREAQHKCHQVLKKLIGEIDTLGSKTFLDYFPEYWCENGSINQKRSIIGKSFETRPWDSGGKFIGNDIR